MKKTIFSTLALAACLAAGAQTEVLRLELNDGTVQTFSVSSIKEMTFGEEEISPAQALAGSYSGKMEVTVGGMFTYTNDAVECVITANEDGTVDFTWKPYSLSETVMGNLSLGECTIPNISYSEEKGGFYKDYSNDGLTQHFKAEKDGTVSMDKDYVLGDSSTILIQQEGEGIKVTNPFKLGAMPMSLSATYQGTK